MHFQWIGGPTFLLHMGRFKLLSDPMFSEGPAAFIMNGHPSTGEDQAPISRHAPLPPLDLDHLELILVSHLHSDHVDREAAERLPKDLHVFAPTIQASTLADRGFTKVTGLDWWQEWAQVEDGETLKITAVPARHAHDDAVNEELGVVNGYLIEHTDPHCTYRCYWTGDTVWFDGLREIKQRIGPVHLLIPHMGAVGKDGPWGMMTLDAEEAMQVLALFEAERVIPIHHHTFSHYVEPIDVLQETLRGTPFEQRVTVLEEGATLTVETTTMHQDTGQPR